MLLKLINLQNICKNTYLTVNLIKMWREFIFLLLRTITNTKGLRHWKFSSRKLLSVITAIVRQFHISDPHLSWRTSQVFLFVSRWILMYLDWMIFFLIFFLCTGYLLIFLKCIKLSFPMVREFFLIIPDKSLKVFGVLLLINKYS